MGLRLYAIALVTLSVTASDAVAQTVGGVTSLVGRVFTQQVRTIDSDSSDAVFRLVPRPATLAPIVTVASQLGLSGIVQEAR